MKRRMSGVCLAALSFHGKEATAELDVPIACQLMQYDGNAIILSGTNNR